MASTPDQVVGLVPVFKKANELAAWAIVDEDTFLWVKQRRYHLQQGYATYGFRLREGKFEGGSQGKLVRCSMHRDLMRLGFGDKRVVDHINGDKLDNRLANLRIITRAQNGQNKPSFVGATSRYCGVSWYSPREQWRVQIMVNGVRTLVGYFDDEDEAGAAAEAFYRANVPYRRQDSVTATPGPSGTAIRLGAEHSDPVRAHLITVT